MMRRFAGFVQAVGLARVARVSVAVAAVAGIAGGSALAGGGDARAVASDSIRGSQQWVLNMMDAYPAWQQSEGAGVTVAVLDSGVNPSVSDLTGRVETGPDLTGLHTAPSSPDWGVHGTWMASIIAGHGHDGGSDGIIGIAPEAKVLSIRVIPEKNDPGYHSYDTEPEGTIQQSLAKGIRDAVRDGAKVLSMSLGYTAPSAAVRLALQYALSRGVVPVASSGNSGQNDVRSDDGFAPVSFPAEYPGVLSVAALQSNGSVAGFSSNNLSVQVGAPGDNVPAQGRDGQYWLVSGTSPACALVAGVAALIKSKYPSLAPDLVLRAITSTARNSSPGSYNTRTGFGAVDAAAALRAAGRLNGQRPAGSEVASSAHFGTGSAAPPEPVPPRGVSALVWFSVLALVSLAVACVAGSRVLRRRRALGAAGFVPGAAGSAPGGAHAAYFGPPAGAPAAPPAYPSPVSPPGSVPAYPSPVPPPASQPGYPPPASQSGYPPPAFQSGYPPPASQSGYPPPASQSGYPPPVPGPAYRSPVPPPAYPSPVPPPVPPPAYPSPVSPPVSRPGYPSPVSPSASPPGYPSRVPPPVHPPAGRRDDADDRG